MIIYWFYHFNKAWIAHAARTIMYNQMSEKKTPHKVFWTMWILARLSVLWYTGLSWLRNRLIHYTNSLHSVDCGVKFHLSSFSLSLYLVSSPLYACFACSLLIPCIFSSVYLWAENTQRWLCVAHSVASNNILAFVVLVRRLISRAPSEHKRRLFRSSCVAVRARTSKIVDWNCCGMCGRATIVRRRRVSFRCRERIDVRRVTHTR